jgi:hypothetical protein
MPTPRSPQLRPSGPFAGRWAFCLAATIAIVMLAAGCGPKLPGTVPVTGLVLHKGRPLAGATVVFVGPPTESGRPAVATGSTDPAGRFTLVTQAGRTGVAPGAVPGSHRVTVSAFVPPKGMSEAEFQRKVEAHHAAQEQKGFGAGGELPQKVSLLAAEFSDATKTRLSAEVTVAGPNEFSFDVE